MAKNWAICIGINGYEYMPPLRYAENDALAMAEFFESVGFQKVYTFTDSSPEIEDGSRPYKSQPTFTRLKWFLRERFNKPFLQPGDNLWFFFSGHGIIHRDRDYLLAIDSDSHPSGIDDSAITVSEVAERLRRCGATNSILVLDACRNEQGSKDAGLNEIHEPGIITLTSCSRGERSYEIEELRHGVFTYALQELLVQTKEKNGATIDWILGCLRARINILNNQYRKPYQTPSAWIDPIENLKTTLLFKDELQSKSQHENLSEFYINEEANYGLLQELLEKRNWSAADAMTFRIILKAANREAHGYMSLESMEDLPCGEIIEIDKRWSSASNRKFGFSVQQKIWKNCGGKKDSENQLKLKKNLGWISKVDSQSKSFPRGYFPKNGIIHIVSLLSHFERCISRARI